MTLVIPWTVPVAADVADWAVWREVSIDGTTGFTLESDAGPLEQSGVTKGLTEYMYYATDLKVAEAGAANLSITTDHANAFVIFVGTCWCVSWC